MRVKRKQKKQARICRSLLPTYLEEFVCRQDFGDAPLKNLILQIRSILESQILPLRQLLEF